MTASRRIVAIGEAMVQMAPAPSGTYTQGFAGDTFNTAWHIAQLLGEQAEVGFLTRIGTDSFSESFKGELAEDGLDKSLVFRDPDRGMGLYVIELHDSERSFHYWRENSAARHLADDPAILRRGLKGADLVHVSGITLAILGREARANLLAELTRARLTGAKICFDPNVRPRLWASRDEARETLARMLEIVDLALPSFDDEAALWGDTSPEATLFRLGSAGIREIVVKNGSAPVSFLADGSNGIVATPVVPEVVDTTGAGDSFNAGFLASRLLGASCEEAIASGQRLSSAVIRSFGACAPRDTVRRMGTALRDRWTTKPA